LKRVVQYVAMPARSRDHARLCALPARPAGLSLDVSRVAPLEEGAGEPAELRGIARASTG
jgi:hypothetical protein